MRNRLTLPSLLLALLLPSLAHAQVSVQFAVPPPPIFLPPPAAYGAVPPHVYIRERIRWHLRQHRPAVVVVQAPPYTVAPPVVVAPPAVYAPPPVYVEAPPLPAVPPPIVAPRPYYYYAPPPPPLPAPLVLVRPRPAVPQWGARFGLGVRGAGQVINDGWNNLGIGGEFLFRASPHLVTELSAEYQKNATGPIDRMDVPVMLGLRVHIGRPDWVVSPYFVFAGGVDIAAQNLRITDDTAIYLDGQVGFGLELRLGQHFAITADARLDAKKRVDDPSSQVVATRSLDGKAVHPLADEIGGQFRLGLAAYF